MGDPGNDPPRPPFAVLRAKLEAKLAEMRQRRRARMPSSPLTDEAWRRGQQNLALRLAAVEEDRREDMARAVAACPVQAIVVDANFPDGNPGTDREAGR